MIVSEFIEMAQDLETSRREKSVKSRIAGILKARARGWEPVNEETAGSLFDKFDYLRAAA